MRTPTVEWRVAGACNYDCSYCIQSKSSRRGGVPAGSVESALAFFKTLPGSWEVKCSGGEAFAHPPFLESVVPGLMRATDHTISVLTNFSASEDDLARFAAMTRGRLAVFSASLHLEYTTVEAFLDKARSFVPLLDRHVRFVVNQVVLPGREGEALACRNAVRSAGLLWFPQLLKRKGEVVRYPVTEALRNVVGDESDPARANLAPGYRGRFCHAGVDYAVLDSNGDLWSCRTAKRHGEGWLGNVGTGTARLEVLGKRCAWDICPCTVPANRGMIEGVERLAVETR